MPSLRSALFFHLILKHTFFFHTPGDWRHLQTTPLWPCELNHSGFRIWASCLRCWNQISSRAIHFLLNPFLTPACELILHLILESRHPVFSSVLGDNFMATLFNSPSVFCICWWIFFWANFYLMMAYALMVKNNWISSCFVWICLYVLCLLTKRWHPFLFFYWS